MPVSAVAADAEIMDVIGPGQHGSTFGGNALAAAVGTAVVGLLETGEYQARAAELGVPFHQGLAELVGQGLTAVRGRGLWAGIDVDPAVGTGRDVCLRLLDLGVLAKDTHGQTLRLAPPLVVSEEEVAWLVGQLRVALSDVRA